MDTKTILRVQSFDQDKHQPEIGSCQEKNQEISKSKTQIWYYNMQGKSNV